MGNPNLTAEQIFDAAHEDAKRIIEMDKAMDFAEKFTTIEEKRAAYVGYLWGRSDARKEANG